MSGQFSWSQSAGDDLAGASKNGMQSFQKMADDHQTAGKQMSGLLEGEGTEQAATVANQMYKRASDGHETSAKQASTDQQSIDVNQQGMARMKTFFANNG